MRDVCVSCHYARMRKDICGIYCVGSFFKKPDGSCDHFISYEQMKREKRKKRKDSGVEANGR